MTFLHGDLRHRSMSLDERRRKAADDSETSCVRLFSRRAGERARGTDPTAHRAHARHRYLVPRLMPLALTIAALYIV